MLEGSLDVEARGSMTRKPRAATKQMERLIESTLMPGRYISHHVDPSFVEELSVVEKQLATLI